MRLPDTFLAELRAPLSQLPELAQSFESTFNDIAAHSRAQFLPTPIISLPDGSETGTFLVLDLGGSNLRVAIVELLGNSGGDGDERLRISPQGSWLIPESLKSGTADTLFGWVAQRTAEIVQAYVATLAGKEREEVFAEGIRVGVAFSFPMQQESHTSAVIMRMGKGFTVERTNNLAALLLNAYDALPATTTATTASPPLRMTAITNDSVATLLSTAYLRPPSAGTHAAAGIIAGTGTNATCLCPVEKLAADKRREGAQVILMNTEWSLYGTLPSLVPIRTAWDEDLAARSEKPGFQPFEEMVGGRYLGELVRLAAVELFAAAGDVPLPQILTMPYAVDTKLCSKVEGAASVDAATEVLRTYFGSGSAEFWDAQRTAAFREIAGAVSDRAAALVAAATIGVLAVNDELAGGNRKVVVGFTGTVLELYWRFRERCQQFLDVLAGVGKVELVGARDGGVIGAAVLAAMVEAGTT